MSSEKYGILADIHGNWEALATVLDDADKNGVSKFLCVGDIVGYNADPARCLEKIREISAATVRGNHDHYCSHDECLEDFHPLAANVVDWTRRQLTDEQVSYLKNLPLTARYSSFMLVHSTLDMPEKWGYVFDALEADAHFTYQSCMLCFYGHTHVPVCFTKQGRVTRSPYELLNLELGRKYFINVGSVGQPRDGDPRSSYVIYDHGARTVELRRLAYDLNSTQKKIRDAGLPERLARRLETGH